jgi:hypothetical protein
MHFIAVCSPEGLGRAMFSEYRNNAPPQNYMGSILESERFQNYPPPLTDDCFYDSIINPSRQVLYKDSGMGKPLDDAPIRSESSEGEKLEKNQKESEEIIIEESKE